ncbi:DEKNAAC101224 [Brettanomyces naardenensis]|uniref:Kinesin-like protein n=1 Tax=Brettanomyces naardenensis TaxID=13370 RepID=A0A448YH33_BRENA|nr:DEKNAAC101224 [Brettanomyces naardenensis]
MSKEASITVAVRIRPLNGAETALISSRKSSDSSRKSSDSGSSLRRTTDNHGIGYPNFKYRPRRVSGRNILEVVDDRMLIFDPNRSRSLAEIENSAFSGRISSISKRSLSGTHVGLHNRRNREHRFVFDRLFDQNSSQEEVYNYTGKPLLDSVLEGYNATVFAYGATGCGKTYTISGKPENPGVIFLTLRDLFSRIESSRDDRDAEVTLSYLEIYNETIRDLLNPRTDSRILQLRENDHTRIFVTNLSEHHPQSVNEVMDMIIVGNRNRTVSPTAANAVSSRSHAVLQINLVQKPRDEIDLQEKQTLSTLSFIDLAGSERASATKNRGVRLHEGANINKSLLALGNCINALCDTKRSSHIPYRDSKLTRLLKFSLGGNCKTVMIVCVSPSASHYDETLNALKYANRAKSIKTKVLKNYQNVNKHIGSYLKIINEQKREIEQLRAGRDSAIQAAVKKHVEMRENCQEQVLESTKRLEKSIEKNYEIKLEKAAILAKSRFLAIQKTSIDQFLDAFEEFNSTLRYEPQCDELVRCAAQLSNALGVQIRTLESEYARPSELDFILRDTSAAVLSKLKEIDGWCDVDEALFTSNVKRISESLSKSTLYESSVIFDESVNHSGPFDFVFQSLFRAMDTLLQLTSSELSEERMAHGLKKYQSIVRDCKTSIEDMIENGFRLVRSRGITPKASQFAFESPTRGRTPLVDDSDPKSTATKRNTASPSRSPSKKLRWDNASDINNIDSGMENIEPTSLTSKSLTATPKIGSPGRMTGLGVSIFHKDDLARGGKVLLPFLLKENELNDANFKEDSSSMEIDELEI